MKRRLLSLQRNFMGVLCFALCAIILFPATTYAQLTRKERAEIIRSRPALWFLSKDKEMYMNDQLGMTKTVKDYNIYKGDINLLIFNNTYDYNWTYVPQSGSHKGLGIAILGVGLGLEYAYRNNRMVSLAWTVGANSNTFGCGAVSGENSVVHQIDLLHSWNIHRVTLSVGPTMAWKRWSHWITYRDSILQYSPEIDDFVYIPKSDIPAPWNEDFEFRHWSAGLKAKVHFRLHPMCSIGIEYSARRAWEKAFRHECDHQLTVKMQIRGNLSSKK